jgi:dienelactone hydrolase
MYGQQIVDLYRETARTGLRRTRFDASSRRAYRGWQRHARSVLADILGTLPAERVPFDLERAVVAETDDFCQERIVYTTRPGLQVPAYLFTPRRRTGRTPAVLCIHGHSAGGKDDTIDPNGSYAQFALRFAELGLVVLAPDQIGFGERKLPEGKTTYGLLTHGLNMLGHTLIGWRYWDLVCALDLLETLPMVDTSRIGVMGLSLGGEMTMFLAGMQPRVHAACVCGYLTSHLGTFLDEPHCTCGALRDLAMHFEHVDLAALIAPRPLFLDSGRNDPMFHTPEAEALVRELRPVYDLFDKPREHLGIEVHDGEHIIAGEQSIPWMVARLTE